MLIRLATPPSSRCARTAQTSFSWVVQSTCSLWQHALVWSQRWRSEGPPPLQRTDTSGVAAAAALLLAFTPLIRPFGSRSTAQFVAATAALPSTTTSWRSWTIRRYSWPPIRKETNGFADKGVLLKRGAGKLDHCGLALPSRTSHCHCHQLGAGVSCALHTQRRTVVE